MNIESKLYESIAGLVIGIAPQNSKNLIYTFILQSEANKDAGGVYLHKDVTFQCPRGAPKLQIDHIVRHEILENFHHYSLEVVRGSYKLMNLVKYPETFAKISVPFKETLQITWNISV